MINDIFMKKIQISQTNFNEMSKLYDEFYKIHGDEDTMWELEDLEYMCQIGQEFMDIFAINFKK